MADCEEDIRKMTPADRAFADCEWQTAAPEEALRRVKHEVRPEHHAAFYASSVEDRDTETVVRLYNLSRGNLYRIRRRLTAKLQETVSAALSEMEFPG